MGCASNQNQHGFTLVEISIVMIIIGLLIGGTFGGMKLIENMQVNRTVQDLKAIESAALTFKDAYGRLPGDMPNTAARLPNCTVAPCATGGNGNRIYDTVSWNEVQTIGMEKFTLWSHLQAADLLSMGTKNTTDLNFGEGQPEAPIGGGYRVTRYNGAWWAAGSRPVREALTTISVDSSAAIGASPSQTKCDLLMQIDTKMDDGVPLEGIFQGGGCHTVITNTAPYDITRLGVGMYDLKGF
jgi:prepilin-type N-terminal cleavage/methylation domain-containing protein